MCNENKIEFMSCRRLAYDKDLDVQHWIHFVIFSITASHSVFLNLLGDSGMPKYFIVNVPMPKASHLCDFRAYLGRCPSNEEL